MLKFPKNVNNQTTFQFATVLLTPIFTLNERPKIPCILVVRSITARSALCSLFRGNVCGKSYKTHKFIFFPIFSSFH